MSQPCLAHPALNAAALLASLVLTIGDANAARVVLGAPAGEANLTMGCLYPMAGRAAMYGQDSIAGIDIALRDLEAERAEGRETPRLRVIIDDDLSKASYGVRLAEDFLRNDEVDVLCGMVSSGVAQAVSRVAQRERVVLIGTDHASSRMTIEAGHRYYFRVTNDSWISMAAGARYLRDLQAGTGWKRLAFIGPDYDYGHVSWTDLQQSLDELGVQYETVAELWPKLYEPDYSLHTAALLQAKPDIVVTSLWGGDFIAFVKQAAGSGLFESTRLANFDTGANYDALVSLGEVPPPGLILSARHHNNWPDTERNRRFVATFEQLNGRYPTYAAQGAYSGVMAAARAVQAAGGKTDSESLVEALEGLRLDLPEDPPGFASWIDPVTHQIVQAQAVGTLERNDRFPPAKVMVGNWSVYPAAELRPSPQLIERRRAQARSGSEIPTSQPQHP